MNENQVPARVTGKLVFACGGMDICWLAAAATQFFNVATSLAPPLILWTAAYTSGYLLSEVFKRVAHRMIHRVFVRILVWCGLASLVIYRLGLWAMPADLLSWYRTLLASGITTVFWVRGTALSKRTLTYQSVCNQFDLTLGMFLSLYIIDMLIAVKGGMEIRNPFSLFMLLCFFFAGPTAVFMAVHPLKTPDKLSPGLTGYGILMGGAVLVVLPCLAGAFIFNPVLTATAEMGGDFIRQAAGPLSPYLIAILKFLLAPKSLSSKNSVPSDTRSALTADTAVIPSETGIFSTIFIYFFGTIVVIAAMALLVFSVRLLYRWLMKKSQPDLRAHGKKSWTLWLRAVCRKILFLIKRIPRNRRKNREATQHFIFLMNWGKRNGLPKLPGETPAEYARRLGHFFPELKTEIEIISSVFEKEIFARIQPVPMEIKTAGKARQKMTHPRFWYRRLRCRCRLSA